MRINFKKTDDFISRLDLIIRQTKKHIGLLEVQSSKLGTNSGTEQITEEIKKIKNKLEEQLQTATKMKISLTRITEIYRASDKEIKNVVDGDVSITKPEFSELTVINDNTSFDWSIE